MKERIQYYKDNDYLFGKNVGMIQDYAMTFNSLNLNSPDDYVELYNVIKYIINIPLCNFYKNEDIIRIYSKKDLFFKSFQNFINTINDNTFSLIYFQLSRAFKKNLFEKVEQNNLYDVISENCFTSLVEDEKVPFNYIFVFKSIVIKYDVGLKRLFLSNPVNAEFMLTIFEIKDEINDDIEYNFPKSITLNDKEKLLIAYIDSKNANLNYIKIITYIISNKDTITISDQTRYRAIKIYNQEIEKHFYRKDSLQSKIEVKIGDFGGSNEEIFRGTNISINYDVKWFDENLDYPTLWNNLIYVFEICDEQFRFSFLTSRDEIGITERFMEIRSKNEYIEYFSFLHNEQLSTMKIHCYYNILNERGLSLEKIIFWFFNVYLKDEFHIDNFIFNIPSENSSFYEKCLVSLVSLEGMLKQYDNYAGEKNINHEFLSISSPIIIEKCRSIMKNNYVYPNLKNNDYRSLINLLFNDQSGLNHLKEHEPSVRNFAILISKENVKLDCFHEYDLYKLNWLIARKYIKENKKGYLKFTNENLIILLYDLYNYGFISVYNLNPILNGSLKELVKKDFVKYDTALLAVPEQEYISYLFNKRQFGNSLDIRNKLLHGTQLDNDESYFRGLYMIILKILCLLIIKINNDLCNNELYNSK